MNMEQNEALIWLSSRENDYWMSREAAMLCGLLRDQYMQDGQPIYNGPIEVEISGEMLRLIILWCERHKTTCSDIKRDHDPELDQWELDFIGKLSRVTILELIMASSRLIVPDLNYRCCRWVLDSIKGKPIDDIRKFFDYHKTD